jgi:excisionase family DNA binding protein
MHARRPRGEFASEHSMAANEDGYLTTADALAYLRTAPRTLYRLLATGEIPAVRMGRRWLFRKSNLDRWLESRPRRLVSVRAATPWERAHAGPRRVLVADDDAPVREVLVSILAGAAYEVEAVSDGLAAIARLRADSFDLLVTDLKMPGVEGIELAGEAKHLRPGIKIVIVTAHPSQSSAIDAVNIGLDGYLTKPFRAMDLLMTVARALEPESVPARSVHSGTDIQHGYVGPDLPRRG